MSLGRDCRSGPTSRPKPKMTPALIGKAQRNGQGLRIGVSRDLLITTSRISPRC